MDVEKYLFNSATDWFSSWGLIYSGVWIFVIFWIFAFGACIGSFLNVCIWRIPRGESLSKSASHCTVCGQKIRWFDNIPVVSYLVLRGKCRSCRTPYSSSYFWVELICGLLTAMLVVKTGVCRQIPEIIPARMLLIFFAVTCSLTDIRFRVVPDKLTYAGMCFALLTAWIVPESFDTVSRWQAMLLALASGAIPGLFLAIFAELGKLFSRKDVIGMGDVKFIALCGMLIGLQGAFFALLAGAFAGAVWGIAVKRSFNVQLPFVPFISLAALVWIFFDCWILNFYMVYFAK